MTTDYFIHSFRIVFNVEWNMCAVINGIEYIYGHYDTF